MTRNKYYFLDPPPPRPPAGYMYIPPGVEVVDGLYGLHASGTYAHRQGCMSAPNDLSKIPVLSSSDWRTERIKCPQWFRVEWTAALHSTPQWRRLRICVCPFLNVSSKRDGIKLSRKYYIEPWLSFHHSVFLCWRLCNFSFFVRYVLYYLHSILHSFDLGHIY